MYNLAPKTAPWFEHLTDSVRSLGYAAHDWQLAAQAAVVANAHAEHPGLTDHRGQVVGIPPADTVGWEARPHKRHPHTLAQRRLREHYRDAMYTALDAYEEAARLYASGAAWAVRQVQAGRQPELVEFGMRPGVETALILVPGSYDIGLDKLMTARYSDAGKVVAAHTRLETCLASARFADDIESRDYVSDREASEMNEAWTVAEGTADAAYVYGDALEKALRFVFLDAKEAHRKQRAAAREAADAEQIARG